MSLAIRLISCLVLLSATARAEVLRLDGYIHQVAASNEGYRGLQDESNGAELATRSAELYFMPQAFTKFEYIRDSTSQPAPEIEGFHHIERTFSVGVRQKTSFGLQYSMSFDARYTILTGTDPTLVPNPHVSNVYPTPLFSLSLWQNFLGKADRANARLAAAREWATHFGKAFEARGSLIEAEGRYWKLASLREAIRLQNDSLARAKVVYELSLKKKTKNLIETSELLLSEAAVQGKMLELKTMVDDERTAARAFNSARGIDSDDVPETLPFPPGEDVEKLLPPKRVDRRGDEKAVEQQSIAAEAGYEAARDQMLPTLNVYGSIFAYGITLSVPLDGAATSDARRGFSQQIEGAQLASSRKTFEVDNEWKELNKRFYDLKERLTIAVRLEDVQRRKFEDLRRMREHGLTIAFQVFQYELDYMNASLARVQIEGLLLGTLSQMKLFGDGDT